MTNPDRVPTILVVDDEEGIRYFLVRLLTREGYAVTDLPDGETALARLAQEEYDVVLLDLKMKAIGGLDVLTFLRRRWPATSVIILTAHASLDSAVEALRRGAHDYLFKPCKTVDLRESVRSGLIKRQEQLRWRQLADRAREPIEPAPTPAVEWLSDNSPAPDRFMRRSGLIVDSIRHVITLDGVLLELSPTEFDLLAYLVSEAPRVVSPAELIREVQGYEIGAQTAAETIRSHMYHIRRKVQTAVGREIFRTVRGVGYALVG